MDKKQYLNIVSFTINSMLDLAKEDSLYSFEADLQHYYENQIKRDRILSEAEFYIIAKTIKDLRQNI